MECQRVGKEIVEKFASEVCGVNNSVLGVRKSVGRSTRHIKSRRLSFPKKKRAPKKSRKPKRRSVKKSRKTGKKKDMSYCICSGPNKTKGFTCRQHCKYGRVKNSRKPPRKNSRKTIKN